MDSSNNNRRRRSPARPNVGVIAPVRQAIRDAINRQILIDVLRRAMRNSANRRRRNNRRRN